MPATPIEIVSVGAKVLYCVETTGGTRPTTGYTELVGISAAPGFDMTPETIDVSDITDTITQYVNGRQDPGGDAQFTLNHSEASITAWEAMVTAVNTALAQGKRCWFEYKYPAATRSYFWCGRPLTLGNGGIEQNAASTIPAHVIPNGEFEWATASTSPAA